jgi:DNA-binding protein HU-beta
MPRQRSLRAGKKMTQSEISAKRIRIAKYSKIEKGSFVNKADLVEVVAKTADISKSSAEKALDGALNGIKSALKKGGSVTLVGFGTFRVAKRAARTGRNPRTGEAIKIKAAKVPKFTAGKALKDAVN